MKHFEDNMVLMVWEKNRGQTTESKEKVRIISQLGQAIKSILKGVSRIPRKRRPHFDVIHGDQEYTQDHKPKET